MGHSGKTTSGRVHERIKAFYDGATAALADTRSLLKKVRPAPANKGRADRPATDMTKPLADRMLDLVMDGTIACVDVLQDDMRKRFQSVLAKHAGWEKQASGMIAELHIGPRLDHARRRGYRYAIPFVLSNVYSIEFEGFNHFSGKNPEAAVGAAFSKAYDVRISVHQAASFVATLVNSLDHFHDPQKIAAAVDAWKKDSTPDGENRQLSLNVLQKYIRRLDTAQPG